MAKKTEAISKVIRQELQIYGNLWTQKLIILQPLC
jgi:hypothetical protein